MSEVPQRIGDAERDQAVAALRDHHAAGRLSMEEFDERMQTALSARTSSDLAPLFSDLPRDPNAVMDFLPAIPSDRHAPVQFTTAESSIWRPQDETEYDRLLRTEKIFTWVHALGWPLVIGINFLPWVDWSAWWLFIVMGVVVGSIHGSVSERRSKLAKRRRRAGLPPHPDDDEEVSKAEKRRKELE